MTSVAEARWLNLGDADVVRSTTAEVSVKADGTHVVEYEIRFEVKTEVGRKDVGTYSAEYNARSSVLKVLDAYTVNGGDKFPVPKEYIEDKPLSTSAEGFDQINRVTLAYPRVEIGSLLFLKVRTEYHETEVPNFFSDSYQFGLQGFDARAHVHVVSEMPLYVATNDPRSKLVVSTQNKNKRTEITIDLKEPFSETPIDEKEPYLTLKDRTWVAISSRQTFAEMGQSLVGAYLDTINSKLPAAFELIVKNAAKFKTGTEQINQVTASLSQQVRYMGDWRAVRGGYLPHRLETIAKGQFGDCKDLAVSTAAILRTLGYEAYPALIYRGHQPGELPPLPLISTFNHAIVWVKGESKPLWIDATNLASFAQGVPDDLLGRPSLILDPKNLRIENTPVGVPDDASYLRRYEITFKPNGDAALSADIKIEGRAAMPWTASELKASRPVIEHGIVNALADNKLVLWSKLGKYDLSSRITRNLDISVQIGVAHYGIRTTAGLAYLLEYSGETLMNLDTKDRVSGLFISWPGRTRSTYVLKKIRKLGNHNIDCQLDSPWFKARRKVYQKGADVIIEDDQAFLQPIMTLADLTSQPFLQVQQKLRDCFYGIGVMLSAPK